MKKKTRVKIIQFKKNCSIIEIKKNEDFERRDFFFAICFEPLPGPVSPATRSFIYVMIKIQFVFRNIIFSIF